MAHLSRPSTDLFDVIGPCHLIVTLIDPDEVATATEDWLRACFGLSAAEARLAVLIAKGTALAETCTMLGIAHETGRSHLKSINSKLGIHSQTELSALLTSVAERLPE